MTVSLCDKYENGKCQSCTNCIAKLKDWPCRCLNKQVKKYPKEAWLFLIWTTASKIMGWEYREVRILSMYNNDDTHNLVDPQLEMEKQMWNYLTKDIIWALTHLYKIWYLNKLSKSKACQTSFKLCINTEMR